MQVSICTSALGPANGGKIGGKDYYFDDGAVRSKRYFSGGFWK